MILRLAKVALDLPPTARADRPDIQPCAHRVDGLPQARPEKHGQQRTGLMGVPQNRDAGFHQCQIAKAMVSR